MVVNSHAIAINVHSDKIDLHGADALPPKNTMKKSVPIFTI